MKNSWLSSGRLTPSGFAALGVSEDQVNVGLQVQFHRTELAHAQHHHLLRLAAAAAGGHAELLATGALYNH